MSLAARVSFVNGFLGYLNDQETERVQGLIPTLAATYERYGSWDFLREDPGAWVGLLRGRAPPPDAALREPPGHRGGPPPFEPPPGGMPPRGPPPHGGPGEPPPMNTPSDLTGVQFRVSLLDAEHHLVAGNPRLPATSTSFPVQVAGRTVGYLAVVPFEQVASGAALRLKDQQLFATWLIGGAAILAAALAAVLLTRRLLLPVRQVGSVMRGLAAGDYARRLAVTRGDEIGRLAHDVNALAQALERTEQMRRAFMADVSHELRTPLAVLRGEVEALQDGVRPVTPATLASLHQEVATLGKLIDDLYQLALADVGALTYRMHECDLADLLSARVTAFRERLGARGITLETQMPDHPLPVRADESRLQQLMGNLTENTVRYTALGGQARLSCRREGNDAVIELEDSAPGVAPEVAARLFERFFRAEGSRNRDSGGAGLGLAICRSIVDAHGGSITARPSALGGLWVTVRLPLAVGT
ncbi:MAG: HAMP domain-containing protein [Proteobacteria bacterium]|nr:HAMP domain-containing protein [Pseudomonadota bacterium]